MLMLLLKFAGIHFHKQKKLQNKAFKIAFNHGRPSIEKYASLFFFLLPELQKV